MSTGSVRDFFGLQRDPFSIAPDPAFLFLSAQHRDALAHLLFGIASSGGFVLLTGAIGAGKTTLSRAMLAELPRRCNLAYVLNPLQSSEEILATICQEFRIPCSPTATTAQRVDALSEYLLRTHAVGQTNVLLIDEAQNLAPTVLEQLRLLTNLETAERKLLQIILIGQPELRELLAQPRLAPLAQRIVARCHLEALSADETRQYIAHRLAVAGRMGPMPFEPAALAAVHRQAQGVPRRINVLCDRALLGAWARGESVVSAAVVEQAALEVAGHAGRWAERLRAPGVWRAAAALGVGILIGAGVIALLSARA